MQGDLLQALHMTREDDKNKTFLFRKQFDVSAKNVDVCVSDRRALAEFVDFFNSKPCLLIGTDEEAVSVLVNKIKRHCPERYETMKQKLNGYSYWKRFLKKLQMEEVDLDEYYRSIPSLPQLPHFLKASEVTEILRRCFGHVLLHSRESDFSVRRHCRYMTDLKKPLKHTVSINRKEVEIIIQSGFRGMPLSIKATKMEQMTLLSSDSEDDGPDKNGNVNSAKDAEVVSKEYIELQEDTENNIKKETTEEAILLVISDPEDDTEHELANASIPSSSINVQDPQISSYSEVREREPTANDDFIDLTSNDHVGLQKGVVSSAVDGSKTLSQAQITSSTHSDSDPVVERFCQINKQMKGNLQKCNLCTHMDTFCKPINMARHYSKVHQVSDWCEAIEHPADLATLESNGFFCHLCRTRSKHKYANFQSVYEHFEMCHRINNPKKAIIRKRILPTPTSNTVDKSSDESKRIVAKRGVDLSSKLPPKKRTRHESSNQTKILGDGIKIKTMAATMRSVPESRIVHQFSVSNLDNRNRFIMCNLCLRSFNTPPQFNQHIRDAHKIATKKGNFQFNIDPTLIQKTGAVETLKRICECSLFDVVSISWSDLESHLKMIHKILENNNTLNMLLQLKVNDARTSITSDPSFVPALERCEILFANGYLGFDSLALSPQVHYEHVFSYDFHPDDNYLTFLRRFLFSFLQCRYIRTSQEMSVPCNVVYQDYRRASLEQWGMSEVLPPFR